VGSSFSEQSMVYPWLDTSRAYRAKIGRFLLLKWPATWKQGIINAMASRETGIAVSALEGTTLSEFDVNERMSWAQGRETKRPEDRVYSLLGIFDIHMPLIYGEGMLNALSRLQLELDRRANEQLPDLSRNPILNPHPVRRNYRKVVVMIIYWQCDQLEMTIWKISNVFRKLYHYEVRQTMLILEEQPRTLEEQPRRNPHWPWPDDFDIDEKDLQIIYYLGNTRRVKDPNGWPDIQAVPFQECPQCDDLISGHRNWLQLVLGIPNLTSDVLLILDCYVETFAAGETITHLSNDNCPWARCEIITAGYAQNSANPGRFSDRFMSTLEDLAHSRQLVNCDFVRKKLMEGRGAFKYGMVPVVMWKKGIGSIILAPIQA